jgi:hypothetical protein
MELRDEWATQGSLAVPEKCGFSFSCEFASLPVASCQLRTGNGNDKSQYRGLSAAAQVRASGRDDRLYG